MSTGSSADMSAGGTPAGIGRAWAAPPTNGKDPRDGAGIGSVAEGYEPQAAAASPPDETKTGIPIPPPCDPETGWHATSRIEDALRFISPDDRDTWVRQAMAIKSELGESGFEIWDSWSQQSASYCPGDARSVWKSIRPTGGVTIRSLYHEARLGGWRNGAALEQEPLDTCGLVPSTPVSTKIDARLAADRTAAAMKAGTIWRAAGPALEDHPYLVRKRVAPVASLREMKSEEVRRLLGYPPRCREEPLKGRLLTVPVLVAGELSTLELIDEDGRKCALAGGQKGGGFWAAQTLPLGDGTGKTILIAEGVATALTVREATGYASVAALTCGNLESVAMQLREAFPAARLIVASDIGPGQGKAEGAARSAGALLALPDLGTSISEGMTDFNDQAVLSGLETVANAIRKAAAISVPQASIQARKVAARPLQWHQPLPVPSTLLPVKPFDLGLLPESVRPWVADIAERMQCPVDYLGVTVMVALSSVIGRKASIARKRYDDWRVIPNLWGLIVGRPATMKSPSLAQVLKVLDELGRQAAKRHPVALREYEIDSKIQEMSSKAAEGEAQKMVKKGNAADAKRTLAAAIASEEAAAPVLRRYKVTDATVEPLGEILIENPWGDPCLSR